MPSIVSVKNLVRHHQSANQIIRAVDDVSFDITQASFTAIVGPSGSGKSTLLSLLAGLDLPTSGGVTITSQNIFEMAEDVRARFRRQNLGFVFQSFQLFEHFTALENVQFPLELLQFNPEKAKERAIDLLTRLGLGDRMGHFPQQLSGGEQQRVAIARAFSNKPALLFADEPTGNLDAETGERIMSEFLEMQSAHDTTLVLVTHDLELAQRADRILKMDRGKLIELK